MASFFSPSSFWTLPIYRNAITIDVSGNRILPVSRSLSMIRNSLTKGIKAAEGKNLSIFIFSSHHESVKTHPANSYKIRARLKRSINIPANEPTYPVLSDVGSVTAKGFGIAFGLDVELQSGYPRFEMPSRPKILAGSART